jgi:hypothetical protein
LHAPVSEERETLLELTATRIASSSLPRRDSSTTRNSEPFRIIAFPFRVILRALRRTLSVTSKNDQSLQSEAKCLLQQRYANSDINFGRWIDEGVILDQPIGGSNPLSPANRVWRARGRRVAHLLDWLGAPGVSIGRRQIFLPRRPAEPVVFTLILGVLVSAPTVALANACSFG